MTSLLEESWPLLWGLAFLGSCCSPSFIFIAASHGVPLPLCCRLTRVIGEVCKQDSYNSFFRQFFWKNPWLGKICIVTATQGYSNTLKLGLFLLACLLRTCSSSPGWPWTHCLVETNSELYPPASISEGRVLHACINTLGLCCAGDGTQNCTF